MAIHILHHADSDGRYASWCAWKYFQAKGIEVNLHNVQYQEAPKVVPENLTREDAVYILDFSYPAPILERYAKNAGKLVVLDHHKSAKADLEGIEEKLDKGCESLVKFDMSKSGALLAWEYFFPQQEAPYVCLLINDRDLWLHKYGDETRALETFIRAKGKVYNIDWWDQLCSNEEYFKYALATGHNYLDYERSVMQKFISSNRNYEIVNTDFNGIKYKCCLYEGMGILHSELAEAFYSSPKHELDFTMEWRRKDHDKMVFSLRSNKIDVSKLAKSMGGGGHHAAAGFATDLQLGFHIVSRFYGGDYVFPVIPEGSILN